MKKTFKRTAAVVLAVATTAGVAGTTAATLDGVYGDNGVKNVAQAAVDPIYYNTLQIQNSNKYKKTVKLNDTFEVPAAKVIDGVGAEHDATFVVKTPNGDEITAASFKVTEIGTYTIKYTYDKYVGELTFVSEASTYSVNLVSNNANILPSKVAIKDEDGNAFKGYFNVPEYKVLNEDGEEVDAIVEITLQTPSYATSDISSTKKVDFNAIDIEEGYYIITYKAYSKADGGVKGDYLAETKAEFNAVSETSYDNEHELTLSYSSEKPSTVNVGKTVVLPAITAKANNENVPVYYTVEVYKNGSTTPVASTAKVNNTDTLIITKNEDGKYEFTADEVGVYYRVVYTVRDAFGELNEKQTEFNIETVEDTLDPTPIVVDAYDATDADELKALKNKDYALKTTFGAEPVIIKAIYAEDLGTFDYADYKFERKIESSSREEIYKSTDAADACKEIVFNDGTGTYDANKYIVVDPDETTLKDGYYYVYYTVTDAHGNKKSVQYKITIDKNFDWLDENSNEIKPTVEFNDTFYSSIELGEKIEFGKITASDTKDDRLETKVYYKYNVAGAEETTLELNDDGKYVIDTNKAPNGATKVTIYAKAINDGGKETIIEEEIALKSPDYGVAMPTLDSVIEEAGYTYSYVQGSKITIPKVIFKDETTTDGTGVDALNASISVKCTDGNGVVTNYTAQDIWSIKAGDYLYVSNANFTAATVGTYQVAVKALDAAGNTVVKFFEYTVTDAAYTGSLRFKDIGLTDTTLELGSTYKLLQAEINGANASDYGYYVTCKTAAGAYELNKSEFKPNAIGEYKLQYVMYKLGDVTDTVSDETVEFTVKVEDTKGPKINVNWETEVLNDTTETQSILPAYEKGTKMLIPMFSASDMSGIDMDKSTITISSSKTSRTIEMSKMLEEYTNGKSNQSGLMYYTFANDAEYTITYTAYDKQGNYSSVSKTIKIGDLVAPTLIVDDKIASETYNIGDTLTIDLADTLNYITVADNKTTDISKNDVVVKLYVNDTEVKKNSASTATKYIFDLSDAGEYELVFSVKDDAGIESTQTKTFTISAESGSNMTSTEVVGTILIVVSVVVLAGVVVYFIVSKKKMDKIYK